MFYKKLPQGSISHGLGRKNPNSSRVGTIKIQPHAHFMRLFGLPQSRPNRRVSGVIGTGCPDHQPMENWIKREDKSSLFYLKLFGKSKNSTPKLVAETEFHFYLTITI